MRKLLVHPNAGELRYAIREIVALGHEIAELGQPIIWENIGDPIQKGEIVPQWIRNAILGIANDSKSWAYCDSAGVPAVRQYLAEKVNRREGGVQITMDDILFFNGLGDAIAKVYGFLKREARVLGPSPAYSTHSSAEAAHSGYAQATYQLDSNNGWLPNIADIRNKVKFNDAITGILLLSPDNPTGAVYPRDILEAIAEIARQYHLFIIADEIYASLVFNGNPRLHMSQWIGDVPGIAMRGISKEYPWPGARCGWIEMLNTDKDEEFARYCASLKAVKRIEVSCTTLPQLSIPEVMGDARYPGHLRARAAMFEQRAFEAVSYFADCDSVVVNMPGGAFYLTVMFKDGVLNPTQSLPIENARVKARIEQLVQGVSPDMRFVYYLMGATGIVVVPLTGFHCQLTGFRVTLLETDDVRRRQTFETIRQSIDAYIGSTQ